MKVYQAHYSYPSSADDSLWYYGSDGDLYFHKEDCQKEIDDKLKPILSYEEYCLKYDSPNADYEEYDRWCMYENMICPDDADIRELEIKESYIK